MRSMVVERAVDLVIDDAGDAGEEILGLLELADHARAVAAEKARRFDVGQLWKWNGGNVSFATFASGRTDISRGAAHALLCVASKLHTKMPLFAEAVAAGEVSFLKAETVARVINHRTEKAFERDEAFLLETVRDLTIDATGSAARYWAAHADPDGPEPQDPELNRVSIHGVGGRGDLRANYDEASTAVIESVIQAYVDLLHREGRWADQQVPVAKRRADALLEALERAAGKSGDGVHADIVVTVNENQLESMLEGGDPMGIAGELIGHGPIDPRTLAMLLLRGAIHGLVVDDDGRPLRLGRKVRLATRDQWLALFSRDHHCVVPGCDRPATWCKAHHIRFWENGGYTDIENLALVCDCHHRMIHNQGWSLGRDPDGGWDWRRPDGTRPPLPKYHHHDHQDAPTPSCHTDLRLPRLLVISTEARQASRHSGHPSN